MLSAVSTLLLEDEVKRAWRVRCWLVAGAFTCACVSMSGSPCRCCALLLRSHHTPLYITSPTIDSLHPLAAAIVAGRSSPNCRSFLCRLDPRPVSLNSRTDVLIYKRPRHSWSALVVAANIQAILSSCSARPYTHHLLVIARQSQSQGLRALQSLIIDLQCLRS